MAQRKRRYLDRLISDLQLSSTSDLYEPSAKKRRTIAVPLYKIVHPLYEFFLIGEINLELQLGITSPEEDYFPIGVKQSPLNKWRPFVKAEQFHNRIEMTIDASYQGLTEFEFIIQKLQGCSNNIYKQLAVYLNGYQRFVRRIKQKMLANPIPPRLYEFKLQNLIKRSTEFVAALPIDDLYAVSLLQLDYNIFNTKRVKFIVSKALAELVGGVEAPEAAQLLLRKGWLEIFGGPQRIMKNIMLLDRLMREGRQLLTFKIHTVDKIPIQISAEIEIIKSLRSFVDVGFLEMIRFSISPETRAYLHRVRSSNTQNQLTFEGNLIDQVQQYYSIPQFVSKDINHKDQEQIYGDIKDTPLTRASQSFRHPNFDRHETDFEYQKKCNDFILKFYSDKDGLISNTTTDQQLMRQFTGPILQKPQQRENEVKNDPQQENKEEFEQIEFRSNENQVSNSAFENISSLKCANENKEEYGAIQQQQEINCNPNLNQSLIESPNSQQVADLNEEETSCNQNQNINESNELFAGDFEEVQEEEENQKYFNMFDDESLNFTAQDLQVEQKRLQKLIYNQYQEKL